MELLLFGIALTATHLLGLFVLFVLFCVSTSYDRRGSSTFKWLLLLGTAITVGVVISPNWNFQTAKDFVLSSALWIPVITYAVLGLMYSGVEFLLTVRKGVREIAVRWASYLKQRGNGYTGGATTPINGDVIAKAKEADATDEDIREAAGLCTSFAANARYNFIGFESPKGKLDIEPKIDRLDLSQYIGAWVVFWPFYLVSLILGDLLSELFQSIADFIAERCGRFVRNAFSGVFKT